MLFPDYPFTPKRIEIRPGIAMSYLDEGPRDGEVVVMLHGNPSWSYYWRHLVLALRDKYRCIVPDHVGMGLSDKPGDADYRYTLQSRVEDLTRLLDTLDVRGPLTLAVHDWGGMIGFGWALGHEAQVRRLLITNTAAFPLPPAKPLPWQLKLGRDSKIGALMIRGFNAFAGGAAHQGVVRAMPADTVVSTDVGSHKLLVGQGWTAHAPRTVLMSNGLSSMGFSLPAAITASLLDPQRPVVCFTGDGGLAMVQAELRVAASLRVAPVVVVFRDDSLNRIELKQAARQYPSWGTRIDPTDIAMLAEAMGCDGINVDSAKGLEAALAMSRSDARPLVIGARIAADQYAAQF